MKALVGKALRGVFRGTPRRADLAGTQRPFGRHILFRNGGLSRAGHREGIMRHTLKTDLALFAAAFIASAFVPNPALRADTSFAHIPGAALGAH